MNTYKKTVVNCETGEIFEVDLTPEEIEINRIEDEKIANAKAEAEIKEQEIRENEIKKEIAKSKFAELGITEDDLRALGL